ncbi:HEAT repeat domain-containing protein [Aeromonas dhakensis]|uniref:HEAT repeat domain-containing protein n=1 Tax=Aeromonas dhakensis TaxID=196024 RepID=UPI0035711BA5
MKYLNDWLERLKSRAPAADYWENWRLQEAQSALSQGHAEGDWARLSRHSNGLVREAAVRELGEQPSPEALTALLERLNDWVPQIRALAKAALQRYLTSEYAAELLYALPQLMALPGRQRDDHGPTLAAARSALQAESARSQVEAAFANSQGQAARFLFALLLEASDTPAKLLEQALAHREMTVRQQAVLACQALPDEQAIALLQKALHTPGASVRVKAMHALLQRLDDPRELLRRALLDASPAMRNLALWAAPRWQLEASQVLSSRLQQTLPEGKREWLGVLGLAADLDTRLQGDWLQAALRAPQSSVRLAAVSNLGDTQLHEQLAALDDPADKVFAMAVRRLSQQPWSTMAEALDARLDRDRRQLSPARHSALMHLRPRWQQLAYLLRRLDSREADEHWLEQIAQWCQRQGLMIDPSTGRDERMQLLERLQTLEQHGQLPPGCYARLA